MKLDECMVAWNYGSDEIKVGPWPDKTGWAHNYICTDGGCFTHLNTSHNTRVIETLKIFHRLIMVYKMDRYLVHKAMLEIDEYRVNCCIGTPGIGYDVHEEVYSSGNRTA